MSDSGQHGEQPKAWTPMTPPAVAARSGQGMLTRIVIGVAALGVMVLGIMQLTQGASLLTGGGAKDATLVHQSFDPANPPALGDPGPAIAAHLQRVAGNETLPDDARRAIDDMVAQTRTATPQRIDEITTLVGATSRGRHVVLDERVMLAQAIPNLTEWRRNAVKQLTPTLVAKICDPGNVTVAQFMQQYNVTLWHAYSMNDGNPPLFIQIPPQKCGAPSSR